jgi:hypothetical protein
MGDGAPYGLRLGDDMTLATHCRMTSPSYKCVFCPWRFDKNQLMIVSSNVMICRRCRNETKAEDEKIAHMEWELLCSMKWLTYIYEVDSTWQPRVRWVPWVQGHTDPNALACPRYRELLISDSVMLAQNIVADIRKLGKFQQLEMVEVLDTWMDEWFNKVKVPQYVPAMLCSETISAHLMEFVDNVLTGPDEYFICRQKYCLMVCHSNFWIHNYPEGQYRCPSCGEKYQPWKQLPGYVQSNKVFVFVDEDGLQAAKYEPPTVSMDGLPRQNQVMIFPLKWPDIDSRNMIQRCRRIFLDIDQRLLVRPPKDRFGFALEHLSLTAELRPWKHHIFRPNTKDIIDYENSQRGTHEPVEWHYKHIEKVGYQGIQLGTEHNLENPMELECFVRTFGLSLWLLERAAASRRST